MAEQQEQQLMVADQTSEGGTADEKDEKRFYCPHPGMTGKLRQQLHCCASCLCWVVGAAVLEVQT